MDMNMLDEIKKKNRPFSVPDGYFSTLEEGVRERISLNGEKVVNPVWNSIRVGFALVISFGFIFGMGYGVMSLTKTMSYGDFGFESDELAILIDGGYIKHDFIDYLYDEIEITADPLTEKFELYEELSQMIELNMSQEELIDLMEEYHENE